MKRNLKFLFLIIFVSLTTASCQYEPANGKVTDEFIWYPVGKGEVTSIRQDGLRCVIYRGGMLSSGSSISCVRDF